MSPLSEDRPVTIDEAADYFSLTPGALRVQRHRNKAPGNLAVKVGAKLLFNPDSLRSWFRAQEQAQAANDE